MGDYFIDFVVRLGNRSELVNSTNINWIKMLDRKMGCIHLSSLESFSRYNGTEWSSPESI